MNHTRVAAAAAMLLLVPAVSACTFPAAPRSSSAPTWVVDFEMYSRDNGVGQASVFCTNAGQIERWKQVLVSGDPDPLPGSPCPAGRRAMSSSCRKDRHDNYLHAKDVDPTNMDPDGTDGGLVQAMAIEICDGRGGE